MGLGNRESGKREKRNMTVRRARWVCEKMEARWRLREEVGERRKRKGGGEGERERVER